MSSRNKLKHNVITWINELKAYAVSFSMTIGIALVITNDIHPSGTKLIPIVGVILLILFPILISVQEARTISKSKHIELGQYLKLELSFLGENIPNILQILSFAAILGLYLKTYTLLIMITGILLVFYLHYKRDQNSKFIGLIKKNESAKELVEIYARISEWSLLFFVTIIVAFIMQYNSTS